MPIDLSVTSFQWFESLQKRYQGRVEIGLLASAEIVHQLIFARRIREAYFPAVVLDVVGIKAALLRHDNFSLGDLGKITSENIDQLIGMLEDLDPRFRYRVSFGEDCDIKAPGSDSSQNSELGLIMSRNEGGMRIDAFARDVEALKLDPPPLHY